MLPPGLEKLAILSTLKNSLRHSRFTRMARKLDPPHPKFNQGLHLRPKLRDLRVGECPGNSTDQTARTPKPWTRRIAPACQPFMTDASVAAVMTTRGLIGRVEVGHCWFILPAREISRKRNGSRHFDIGSSHYRRRQGSSPAVSDRSSFRAIRDCGDGQSLRPQSRRGERTD